MSDLVIVSKIEINSRETLRVGLETFKGERLVDLRMTVALTDICTAQTPTKIGVGVPAGKLSELISALIAADFRARELGWFGGGE